MSLNSYNNHYRNFTTNQFEPLLPECAPLVTMEMIKKHFENIKQVKQNIDDLDRKVTTGDESIKLGLPSLEIKCINCDTLQLLDANDPTPYCVKCNQHPYTKTEMTLEDYLGSDE